MSYFARYQQNKIIMADKGMKKIKSTCGEHLLANGVHSNVEIERVIQHKNSHNFPNFLVACDLSHSYQNHCVPKRLVCFVVAVDMLLYQRALRGYTRGKWSPRERGL